MSEDRRPIDELVELHVLGLLHDADRDELLERLAEGEGEKELQRAATTAAALALTSPPVELPEGAREQLLDAALAETLRSKPEDPSTPHVVVPWSEDWEPVGVAGISMRRLFLDPRDGAVTMLIKMAPGAGYPGHRHGAAEETFVIEGDLRIGALVMGAGDFHRCAAGSIHQSQSTVGGCTVLLRTYLRDELLDV